MEQNMFLAIDEKKYYATVRILPGAEMLFCT